MISIGYMTVRRSHPEVLVKKAVLWNFAKLTRKPLCQSLFFNKVAGLRSLPQLFSFELCEISNNTFFYTLTAQLFFIKKKIISLDFIFLCLNTFQSINAWPIVRNTAAQKFYLFLELVNISSKTISLSFYWFSYIEASRNNQKVKINSFKYIYFASRS